MSGLNKYTIIFTRRHPEITKKDDIWQLIYDSYYGGTNYKDGDYLYKHSKESENSYTIRKKRAVYFNQIQPLADLLAGFLFIQPPSRKNVDSAMWLLSDATSQGKNLDEFMKTVATHSILFTCGVLVDSPSFDPEVIKTEKDRVIQGLSPYCTLYMPFNIRDFYFNPSGVLEWVILDDSVYDNSDYLVEGVNRKIYKLWTREFFQEFELLAESTNGENIKIGDQIPHNLGEVPFRFINWKDDNSDFIAESVFEDPAMISRLIYNKLSEMDEMIASGSFRVLMYPTKDGKLPASLVAGGIGSLSAIPFDGNMGKSPFFDGAKLDDVAPFLKAMEFYISEILKKIGLDTDETKDYVKSGLAKKIDFQKVRTLLTSGSVALAELEKWIFSMASKWQGTESKAEIHYTTRYADEDIQVKADLLSQLLVHPFKKLRQSVTSLLVKLLLTGELPQEELDAIYQEIETESDRVFDEEMSAKKENVNNLASMEEQATDQPSEDGAGQQNQNGE